MSRTPAKKEAMEEAAIRLFASKGLFATTVKDIAREAGVTEGALYRHYAGKEDMAWSLYCREVRHFIAGVGPLLEGETLQFEQRISAVVEYIYSYYRNLPDKLIFVLFTRQGFPDRYLARDEFNPDTVLSAALTAEMERGAIPETDIALLFSMLRGLILEPIMMHRYGFLESHPLTNAAVVSRKCLMVLTGELQ